jgi:hypothetical protein
MTGEAMSGVAGARRDFKESAAFPLAGVEREDKKTRL